MTKVLHGKVTLIVAGEPGQWQKSGQAVEKRTRLSSQLHGCWGAGVWVNRLLRLMMDEQV